VTFSDANYPKPPNFRHFVSSFISSQWVEIETSNLVGRLSVAIASPWMVRHRHFEFISAQTGRLKFIWLSSYLTKLCNFKCNNHAILTRSKCICSETIEYRALSGSGLSKGTDVHFSCSSPSCQQTSSVRLPGPISADVHAVFGHPQTDCMTFGRWCRCVDMATNCIDYRLLMPVRVCLNYPTWLKYKFRGPGTMKKFGALL